MNYEELKSGLKGLLDKATDPEDIQRLTDLVKGTEGLEADDKSKADLIARQAKSIKDLFLNTPTKGPAEIPPVTPDPTPAAKSFAEIVAEMTKEKNEK